jgi:hypothetical protein
MTEVDWVNLQGGTAGRRLAAEPGIIDAFDPEIPLHEFAAAVAAIPCGSWSPIVRTGPGAPGAIARRGIRRRGSFARTFGVSGRMSSEPSRGGS